MEGRARRWRAGQGEHFWGGRHGMEVTKQGFGCLENKGLFWVGAELSWHHLFSKRRQPAPQVTASTVVLREASHSQGCGENQVVAFTNELAVYKINLYSNLPPHLTRHLSVCLSRRCKFLTLTCKYTTI